MHPATANALTLSILEEFAGNAGHFKPSLRLSTLGGSAELLGGVRLLLEYAFNDIIFKETIIQKGGARYAGAARE